MIAVIKSGDVPVKIKICMTGAAGTSSTEDTYDLTGIQVYYGTYADRAYAIAGPAHGDVRNACTDYNIEGHVSEVAGY